MANKKKCLPLFQSKNFLCLYLSERMALMSIFGEGSIFLMGVALGIDRNYRNLTPSGLLSFGLDVSL